MKKLLLLLAFMPLCISCSDDEGENFSLAPEKFSILMAVTNNEGKDLVSLSDDYLSTGDYAKHYRFESWNAYLGDKLVQSNKEDAMSCYKPTLYNSQTDQYFISLETDGRLQAQMKDWNKKHVAKYVVVSPSLFGDTKEHVFDLEIQGIEDNGMEDNMRKEFLIDFSISVDGVKQNVYYPKDWGGLYPKDPHGNAYRPYFVLNVDAL